MTARDPNKPAARRRDYWILVCIVLVSSLSRLVPQVLIPGFLKGDDHEIVEDAAAPFLGIAESPWNIRNLAVSRLVVRPFVKLAEIVGAEAPNGLVFAASIPFILASAVNVVLLYVIGTRWGGRRVGLAAAFLYAFHWIPIVYGTGGFPRPLAVTLTLGAVLLLDSARYSGPALAGFLMGGAFAVRYSEVIVVPGLLLLLRSGEKSGKRIATFVTGFAASTLIFVGLFDWLTWGSPFSSLSRFAEFTLLERASSSRDRVQPIFWYLGRLHEWAMLPALAVLRFADRRVAARSVPLIIASVVALSLIHHKEVRYLQVVLPFVAVLAAASLVGLSMRYPRWATVLLLATICIGLLGVRQFARRSSAATLAAQWMNTRYSCLAASQAWAYGGRIHFKGTVRDFPVDPTAGHLSEVAPGCAVGLYRNEMTRELTDRLASLQCTEIGEMSFWRSRPVMLFDCSGASPIGRDVN